MTRKHFEALAAALRSNAPNPDSDSREAELFESIVKAVAGACGHFNPRFKRDRFEKASGLAEVQNRHSLRDAVHCAQAA